MFITLPLALIGVGFMIYLLFAAATYAVPLYAGFSAGFAALHAGTSYTSALLVSILAFLFVIMLVQIAMRLLPSRQARAAIALVLALPAAVAGFEVASALLHIGGGSSSNWSVALALAAALATGTIAAKRHQSLPNV